MSLGTSSQTVLPPTPFNEEELFARHLFLYTCSKCLATFRGEVSSSRVTAHVGRLLTRGIYHQSLVGELETQSDVVLTSLINSGINENE